MSESLVSSYERARTAEEVLINTALILELKPCSKTEKFQECRQAFLECKTKLTESTVEKQKVERAFTKAIKVFIEGIMSFEISEDDIHNEATLFDFQSKRCIFIKERNVFWTQFYKAFYKKMYAVARKFSNSNDAAEELIQEILIRKLLSYPFSQLENVLNDSWLYVVIRNYCFDRIRLRKEFDDLESTESDVPSKEVNAGLDCEAILKALPDNIREIIRFKVQGFSYKEIAKKLDLAEHSIKMRIKRFRGKSNRSEFENF